MRIACVLIPRFHLAVELLVRAELRGRPVVLGGAPDERKLVIECSPEAERDGVRRGMPLREALARCRDAVFLEAKPPVYADRFEQVLSALETISPVVEATSPGCALLDLTGLPESATPSGELRLAEAIQRGVQAAAGLTPRVGIADTRFAAWVAAAVRAQGGRHDRVVDDPAGTGAHIHAVPPGASVALLTALPVHRLPLSEEVRRRLRWLGVRSAGELAALPRAALAAQFGPEGATVWDLVHGAGDDRLVGRRHSPEVSGAIEFAQPLIEAPAILAAARHLLDTLLNRSECAGRAVRGIEVKATLGSGHAWQRTVALREPSADRDRMLRALAAKIEGTTFSAAVVMLELRLRDLCAEAGNQGSLFATHTRQLHNLSAALEHLHARFGRPLVMKVVGVEPWSRLPERQYALIACEPSTRLGR